METFTDSGGSGFEQLVSLYIKAARPDTDDACVGNAIEELQRRIGCGELDIDDVISCLQRKLKCKSPPVKPSFGDLARACRDLDRGQLSPKERAFVGDMVRRGFAFLPSPRQAAWINDILKRLQERAAA